MLALWLLLTVQDDLQKTIDKLGSSEIKVVEQARHDLIDYADDAIKPLQAFLEKNPSGRAAEQAKLVLQALEIRKKLTERIYLSYPYVEENIAAAGRDALLNLLQKMLRDQDRNSLTAPDYQAVINLMLAYSNLSDECKKAVLDTVNAHSLRDSADRIVPLVGDPNADLAEAAAFTLVKVGSGRQGPEVAKLLADSSAEVRARAIKVIGHLKYRDAIDAIAKLLEDPSANVRARAIAALAVLGARKSVPELVKKLGDPDSEVRETAASALVELGARDQIPEIVKLLDAKSPIEIRKLTLKLLSHLNDPSCAPALLSLLTDEDKELKAGAIVALGKVRAPDVAPRLLTILKTEAGYREEAVTALTALVAEAAIGDLVTLLRHETAELRSASLEILRHYKGDVLAKALKNAEPDAAREIAALLAVTRLVDAQFELRALAQQKKDTRQGIALITLAEFGDASVKSPVTELALQEGPLQIDALLALNAYANRSLYADGLTPGFRAWEFKTTVEKAFDEISAVTGQRFVGSDRIPKETRDAVFEFKGVRTPREVLAELSRRHKIGFLFEKDEIRAVPLDEAVEHWKK